MARSEVRAGFGIATLLPSGSLGVLSEAPGGSFAETSPEFAPASGLLHTVGLTALLRRCSTA